LNAAAVSLEAAAGSIVAANGGGAVGAAAGAAKGRGWLGAFGSLLGASGTVLGLGAVQSGSSVPLTLAQTQHLIIQRYIDERNRRWRNEQRGSGGNVDAIMGGQRAASDGGNPLQAAVDHATAVGGQLKTALSVKAAPQVDTSSIDAAIVKAHELARVLGVAASAARQSASDVSLPPIGSSVSRDMNRSFADHGIAP
jgi:hypothetical protein